MKLLLLLIFINLLLAMAVVGMLQVRRTGTTITITFETAMLASWYQTLKEVGAELISNTLRRHRQSSDDIGPTGVGPNRHSLSSREN